MMGIGFALLWSGLVTAGVIATFRAASIRRRFRVICLMYLIGMVGFCGMAAASWPQMLAHAPRQVEAVATLVNGWYLYTVWVFGVLVHVYATADRGISAAMLTTIADAAGPVSREELRRRYAGGQGLVMVRQKRLQQILHSGLLRLTDQAYQLSRVGAVIGRTCWALHRLYGFRQTG